MTDQRFRILVADDEPTARLLMRAALQKASFEVELAVDGADALRQFRAQPCDLVMLDVEMPGLDGYQVCAALRAEAGGDLPIVMATAMDDTRSIEQAYECGATDFIAKPFNWSLIGHRVKYLLRAYQAALDLRAAHKRIYQHAFFDSLTGLPNRPSFLERLEREVKAAQRETKKLAILFIDLDGFKAINDSLGHNTGDLILQWASERMRHGIRPDDVLARTTDAAAGIELARLGGDEFTVLIPDIAQAEDALRVAHRIRELMRRPFEADGRDLVLTASIGIALYPEDGHDAASLLKHADTAMYHAKDRGRDNCQFYNASLTRRAQHRLNLDSNLRRALDRGEFSLVYQPQIDLASGRVHSVEALLRWNHPELGLVSPLDFIPLAEENGLIVPIGEWVLRTACADTARWQQHTPDLRVAVNLSPLQFKDPRLLRTVLDILVHTGLAPDSLELEVTEGAVMEDSGATLATLHALRLEGVRIGLDDFGTGYSSMSYLKRMPLNNLKVDQSFVKGLPHDRDNVAIVRAILSMAKNFGFSVTAEGVETLEQAHTLAGLGCDTLQGYYFSRPVAAAGIPDLLSRRWPVDEPKFCHVIPFPSASGQ